MCLNHYSDAEWAKIDSAVAWVRQEPLSKIERDALLIAADDYLVGKHSRVPSRAQERKAWTKVSKKIAQLQQAINSAAAIERARLNTGRANIHEPLIENTQITFVAPMMNRVRLNLNTGREPLTENTQSMFVVTTQMIAAVVGKEKFDQILHSKPFLHLMTVSEANILLSELEGQAVSAVLWSRCRPHFCWSHTGRLEPAVPYMQQILWLWTHRFGGKPTLSVDPSHSPARVHGPLVEYLAAVAGPIMKGAAPRQSSLRDVVRRQRAFYAKLRKLGLEIEPVAYNRAKVMRKLTPYRDVASQN
jgi:hypothetical protein